MRLLELFSGTGSIGQAFQAKGWEVISLDILPGATINEDILSWDHTIFPPGHFDFIWASPPCTEYSKARARAKLPRDYALADAIVRRALDILDNFLPGFVAIGKSGDGLFEKSAVHEKNPMAGREFCRYGYPYKKQTILWGIFPFRLRPICSKRDPCGNVVDGRHPFRAQREHSGIRRSLEELYSLPPELCDEMACLASFWI